MVDNIKLNKILPSLSSPPKVKPTDQRRRSDQQYPFEVVIKKRRRKKKKKDHSENAGIPDDHYSTDDGQTARPAESEDAAGEEKPIDSASSRIIDIRV